MELSQMTALELSRNIRGKKICVSDSVESVFHQIRKKEKKIHAYLDLYEEDAYKRADCLLYTSRWPETGMFL